ncbi:hypothetical protein YC2023_111294 [Brassica napus]
MSVGKKWVIYMDHAVKVEYWPIKPVTCGPLGKRRHDATTCTNVLRSKDTRQDADPTSSSGAGEEARRRSVNNEAKPVKGRPIKATFTEVQQTPSLMIQISLKMATTLNKRRKETSELQIKSRSD